MSNKALVYFYGNYFDAVYIYTYICMCAKSLKIAKCDPEKYQLSKKC